MNNLDLNAAMVREARKRMAAKVKTPAYVTEILEGKWDDTPNFRKTYGEIWKEAGLATDDEPRDLALREEIASLICIHENGIGTRELVEAQEGTDHQGEWQSALKTADVILDMLRSREDLEASIKRVIDKAFAADGS